MINRDSQVQRYQLFEKDAPANASIPGLYAAGELMPYHVHYGYAISRSMSEARLAVAHALAR